MPGTAVAIPGGMLWLPTPAAFAALLQAALATTSAAPAADPHLELTAFGERARRLAADVLIDADRISDLVLDDGAARFDVELAGERHQLRLELGDDGRVLAAALWWTGEGDGAARYDVTLALPALMDAESLDAVTAEDGAILLDAGGVIVPLGPDLSDDLDSPWPHEGDDAGDVVGC